MRLLLLLLQSAIATGSRSRILAPASTRSTSYTAAEEVINIQIFKRRAAITK